MRHPRRAWIIAIVFLVFFVVGSPVQAQQVASPDINIADMTSRLVTAERRAGQARDLGWAVLALSALNLLLLGILLLRRGGQPGTADEQNRSTVRLQRRHQALGRAVAEMNAYFAQMSEDKGQVADLVQQVNAEFKAIEKHLAPGDAAPPSGPADVPKAA